jgi:hypothetical protein
MKTLFPDPKDARIAALKRSAREAFNRCNWTRLRKVVEEMTRLDPVEGAIYSELITEYAT